MISYQEELFFFIFVDVLPRLQSIRIGISRSEGQGHFTIVAFAIDRRSKAFEAFHQDDRQSVRRVESHVGKQKLAII